MDQSYRLERHTLLWQDANTKVKRTVIASLVLGVLLLLNVLKPYAQDLDKRRQVQAEIDRFQKEKTRIEESIQAIDKFKITLDRVLETIVRQPWMGRKNELINTLARINNRGEGSWRRYQQEADNTVRLIGEQVNQMVSQPLEAFFSSEPNAVMIMPELHARVEKLPQSIEKWVTGNLGKRWYRTLESKSAHVENLSHSLERDLNLIVAKIRLEKPNLVNKRRILNEKISRIEKEADIQAKELLLKTLEARMEKILPEWVRGLVSVRQMIQIYPLFTIAAVICVAGLAFSVRYHYRRMSFFRKEEGFDMADPLFSSLWTPTFRGPAGTSAMVFTYVGFLAAMWILFESGTTVSVKCLAEENWMGLAEIHLEILRWCGRIIFSLMILIVVFVPFFQKDQ